MDDHSAWLDQGNSTKLKGKPGGGVVRKEAKKSDLALKAPAFNSLDEETPNQIEKQQTA